ncbi:MAG: DNA-directed RNA polymerase subunit omega [Firmicutes bacterium]|nr:DNA-directed RNA polymerase subunit omega [Bacillota bacterium]MDY5676234.1 DNA-directed RNA polymerase subunit omega [Eubacteriales bacterium]
MLLEPPIDELVEKMGNPYKLAVIVGKRAKFLNETLTEEQKEEKPEVTRAVEEVDNGTIVIANDTEL